MVLKAIVLSAELLQNGVLLTCCYKYCGNNNPRLLAVALVIEIVFPLFYEYIREEEIFSKQLHGV
jgi:hypothetical protein